MQQVSFAQCAFGPMPNPAMLCICKSVRPDQSNQKPCEKQPPAGRIRPNQHSRRQNAAKSRSHGIPEPHSPRPVQRHPECFYRSTHVSTYLHWRAESLLPLPQFQCNACAIPGGSVRILGFSERILRNPQLTDPTKLLAVRLMRQDDAIRLPPFGVFSLLVTIATGSTIAPTQVAGQSLGGRVAAAARTERAPRLDGTLEDSVWKIA